MTSIVETSRLDGRVALVTGATGHLGRVFCDVLAELGASVALVDLHETKESASRLRKSRGVPSLGVDLDLRNLDHVQELVKTVQSELGPVEILVNNAAYVGTTDLPGWAVRFEEQDPGMWPEVMSVNVTAPFALAQAFTPQLRSRERGVILNIGSIYGSLGPDWSLYQGLPLANPAAYATSKGGILELTKWLATSLAPEIRVNALSPGGIERDQPEPFRVKYESRTPLGRMGTEDDLRGAAAFLLSDMSAYVTGQNVIVDGGFSAW